jgi:hypothetical protein
VDRRVYCRPVFPVRKTEIGRGQEMGGGGIEVAAAGKVMVRGGKIIKSTRRGHRFSPALYFKATLSKKPNVP